MSDLESYWGKVRTFLITVSDDNGRVDLSGKDIRFTAKISRLDPDPPLITKNVASGVTLLTQSGATKGQARVHIDGVDTKNHSKIHAGRETDLEWDAELIDGADTFIVDSGIWTVKPPVRRT